VRQYATPPVSYDGLNWSTAFPSIDAAFSAGVIQADDQLWVAASGATPYLPTQNSSPGVPRSAHFKISQTSFTIRGGYPSNPPDNWDARDVAANLTVCSGDLEGDDPEFGTLPNDQQLLDNAYRVFEVVDVGNLCVIDGLVIRDGHNYTGGLPLEDGYYGTGGGMRLTSATPGDFASPYIQNCTFLDNFAANSGGALAAVAVKVSHFDPIEGEYEVPGDYTSLVKVRTCEFRGNTAYNVTGGAIEVSRGGLDVAGTLIADNHANSHGSGIHAFFPTPLRITNCTITNNNGSHSSAGVACGKSEWQPPEPELPEDPPLDIFIVQNSIVTGNFDDQPGGGSGEFGNQLGGGKSGLPTKPQVDYSIVYEIDSSFGEGNQSTFCYEPNFFYDSEHSDIFARDYRVKLATLPIGPVDFGDPVDGSLPLDEKDADDDGNVGEKLPDVRRAERLQAAEPGGAVRVDIGAYEMTQAEVAATPPVCIGDLDVDGDIGASDLAILLGEWSFPGCADFDMSGLVGAGDLAILLGAWGPCPATPTPENSSFGESSTFLEESESSLTPWELAWLYGFESVESLAAWLGTLPAEIRAALLAPLGD
jgi:predicted outer membrane repeat protein